ncbi:MAG: hypothetical protein AB8B85_08150 [Paracoccaceae bacterium]
MTKPQVAGSGTAEPGTRLSLEAFLAERAPEIANELRGAADELHHVAGYLGAALGRHPELAMQVSRLGNAVPTDIPDMEAEARRAVATEANQLAADIKARWIAAEDPPLVDEIDDRLAEISGALETLRRPGPEALQATADEIDRLARQTTHLDGIEQRYLPWALGAGVLFVLGLSFFFYPSLLEATPFASIWTILACLGALPAVGIHYARAVLPRTETDTSIDRLNRQHFIPLGGLYFPKSAGPACVVIIAPAATRSDGDQAREERRRHRERLGPFW